MYAYHTRGLDNWKEAEVIDELKEIFELSPPPIALENDTLGTLESNYLSSENSSDATNSYSAKKHGMFSNPLSFDGRIRRTKYGFSLLIFDFTSKGTTKGWIYNCKLRLYSIVLDLFCERCKKMS